MYKIIEKVKNWFKEIMIKNWLKKMGIKNYVINEDLTVNLNGTVDISYKKLKKIPIIFGVINGDFYCSYNELTSLKGCPEVINGNFYCNNNELTSLEGFPQKTKGDFIFFHHNNINEEELVNFNCDIRNIKEIYSDFNVSGDKEVFLEKIHFYKSKKENELLKEISANSNKVKSNKKL